MQSTDGRREKRIPEMSRGQGGLQASKNYRLGFGRYTGSHTLNTTNARQTRSSEKLGSCSGNVGCTDHIYLCIVKQTGDGTGNDRRKRDMNPQ